jgi:hypothetical protein
MDPDRPDEWSDEKNRLGRVESGRSTRSTPSARHHSVENKADKTTHGDKPAQPHVYTKTDRRRGQVMGAKRRPARKRGPPPFEPTEQQRHVVSLCAGVKMGHNEIARLILHPGTGKPICGETLEKYFPEELATGNARLKMALSQAFYKLMAEGSENSVLFGMRAICGFDDRNIQAAAFSMKVDGADGKSMKVEFVLPGARAIPMDELDQLTPRSSHARQSVPQAAPRPASQRIAPRYDDIVIERADRQPSVWARRKGSWMD